MKATNLKWIAIALSALLVFQSCKVYHTKSVIVDEIVLSQKRVKIITADNIILKLEKLEREDGQRYD